MNTLLFVLGIFIIGVLALYAVKVAKNIAYVAFVFIVGWMVWKYGGPYVFGPNPPSPDSLLTEVQNMEVHQEKIAGVMTPENVAKGVEVVQSVAKKVVPTIAIGAHASAPEGGTFEKYFERFMNFVRSLTAGDDLIVPGQQVELQDVR
ncbi:MAG: hypothetical protein Q7R81_00865 [Candidatus Peregrinibacteria bacterium]|nr:hypothetical protein [Candidatus Peregrinibacteria bacterium]